MTIKVGETYRIEFAGEADLALVTKIKAMSDGGARIYYKVVGRWPRWLWWLPVFVRNTDSEYYFGHRMDLAAAAAGWVKEVELKYR